MEWRLEDGNETTSVELRRLIAGNFRVMISSAAICKHLCESLQWVVVKTRCGAMISNTKRSKRGWNLWKCVWRTRTTLTSSSWQASRQYSLRGTATPCVWRWAGKYHSNLWRNMHWKFMFWAGISKRGATNICHFKQMMDASLYVCYVWIPKRLFSTLYPGH